MNAERMKMGLLIIADNLRGPRWDNRPISNEMCRSIADFAIALANDQPWPEFDASSGLAVNMEGSK